MSATAAEFCLGLMSIALGLQCAWPASSPEPLAMLRRAVPHEWLAGWYAGCGLYQCLGALQPAGAAVRRLAAAAGMLGWSFLAIAAACLQGSLAAAAWCALMYALWAAVFCRLPARGLPARPVAVTGDARQ